MAAGIYTDVGFLGDDVEVSAVKREKVHLHIDRLSVLLDDATARKLRDELIDLELGEASP